MSKLWRLGLCFLLVAGNPIFVYGPVWAVDGGIGISVPVDPEAVSGSVICSRENAFKLCVKEYDEAIYGVVSDEPAVAFEARQPNGEIRTVIANGIVKVRVGSANGDIKKGDSVTSSTIPGVAQLADQSGFVLGVAMEDYSSPDKTEVGKIQVALQIHLKAAINTNAKKSNILQFLRKGLSSSILDPLDSLRYFLAAIVMLAAFILGITYFGRVSRTGIEAMGRNPLARRSIQLSIVLNVVLTLVMVLVGLGLAYLILIL